MRFKTSDSLTEEQVSAGLKLVVRDGLATEAMVAFTSGTFLVAMALYMGASNFQIGLMAALPTLANIFQLISVLLVQRFNNRRAISVVCSFFARSPLIVIGALPFLLTGGTSIQVLIFVLFFHYFFGAIAGPSWNSWMKDLVPADKLGNFFSHRTRLMQIFNVTLSLLTAFVLDFVKTKFHEYEILAYSSMFILGGILGIAGSYMLYRTPEPTSFLKDENMFRLIRKPLADQNFRRLLVFNTCWAFALNMATPFFSVYLLKGLGLPLSTIIGLNILSQVCGILFVKIWGRYSDKFSNKTIIRICAPVYVICILAWSFTGSNMLTIPILVLIHIVSGIATSGINLAINNIGIKLAPKDEAIVYIAAKNMITALIPALAPLLGGLMADFFAVHSLSWNISWAGPGKVNNFNLFNLSNWSFFFVIGSLMALFSLRFLKKVKEEGEAGKEVVLTELLVYSRIKWKHYTSKRSIRAKVYRLASLPVFSREQEKKRA